MGWKKDDEEDRAFWDQMRINQVDVLNEDIALFATIQRSMATGEMSSILLGHQEQQIYWYNEEIDRKIGVENVPDVSAHSGIADPKQWPGICRHWMICGMRWARQSLQIEY